MGVSRLQAMSSSCPQQGEQQQQQQQQHAQRRPQQQRPLEDGKRQPWFKRATVVDHLLSLLPDWAGGIVRSRHRQLLFVERQIQRRLYNEYRAQLREFEPMLHTRGRILGEIILEQFMPNSGRAGSSGYGKISYADVVTRSLQDTAIAKLPVREMVEMLDPLVEPVISPFVDGLKQPIVDEITGVQQIVVKGVVASCIACTMAGFVVGRFGPGSGRGRGS